MATFSDIVKTSLNEAKDPIKIYYDIDVFIQEFQNDEDGIEDENLPPTKNQVADQEVQGETPANEETITEAIYKRNKRGELVLKENEAKDLLTLNDLIDFMNDKKVRGVPLLDKVSSEIILILGGAGGEQALEDIVNEGDKVKVQIDYGLTKYNNIGFRLNKNAGTKAMSFMLRKDDKTLGYFNLQVFEKQMLALSQQAS